MCQITRRAIPLLPRRCRLPACPKPTFSAARGFTHTASSTGWGRSPLNRGQHGVPMPPRVLDFGSGAGENRPAFAEARGLARVGPGARTLRSRMSFLLIFAKRFVAGTIEGAIEATKVLNGRKVHAPRSTSWARTSPTREATALADEYLRLLDAISEHELDANVLPQAHYDGPSTSATRSAATTSSGYCRRRRRWTASCGSTWGSAYTQRTLDLFYDMYTAHPKTSDRLQSYLYRSEKDVEDAIRAGCRVRLCKGRTRARRCRVPEEG